MEHRIITIFYIIDKYLKKDNVRTKISNNKILLSK